MKSDITDIINQHRKKTKRQLVAEATAKQWEENWTKEYKAKLQAEEDAVPLENRKEFIRLFKAGGITLGDAARQAGVDFDVAIRVLHKQIEPLAHHIKDLK